MSAKLAQAERWLTLESPLGEDVLLPTGVTGVERISALFEFKISVLSSKETIKPGDLLGQEVTLSMAKPGGDRRIVHGIVTAFAGGATTRSGYRIHDLIVAPKLWVLTRVSDYKVFQKMTAIDIIESILGDHSVAFKKSLQSDCAEREYCVQFGETDLEFVERLLDEEGIFYYFVHETSGHKLVLCDNAGGYPDCAQSTVQYRHGVEGVSDAASSLSLGAQLTDAKYAFRDYDFETPKTMIDGDSKSSLDPASGKTWEHFVYPGLSTKAASLKRFAGHSVDAADATFETASGESACASLTPGHRFTLEGHPVKALNGVRHLVTEITHSALDPAHFAIRPGMEGKPFYRNEFITIPASRTARPPRRRIKPLARGPQTALVVGPSGEEIHTDKYGRIRVQFHWDRAGKKDEKSSCFVHVAQSLAGNGWGSVFIPRVGMEVVVHFLDGDPDRPLVTGAVYNGANSAPWTVSADSVKTGLMTRSLKSGAAANANELSFEDKKGSEKVLFHAEKDFVREVENDDTLSVGNDQKRTIKNKRTTTIEDGDETLTIKKGNRTETLESGNETLKIEKGNRAVTLERGNDTLTVSVGNKTTKVSAGKILLEAGKGITIKCGSNSIEITPQGVTVSGLKVMVKADASTDVKGAMVNVSGSATVAVKGGIVKIN